MNTLQNFSKGLVKENPVLVLVLGTCPTLATSTSISNALGMGLAATVVPAFAAACDAPFAAAFFAARSAAFFAASSRSFFVPCWAANFAPSAATSVPFDSPETKETVFVATLTPSSALSRRFPKVFFAVSLEVFLSSSATCLTLSGVIFLISNSFIGFCSKYFRHFSVAVTIPSEEILTKPYFSHS